MTQANAFNAQKAVDHIQRFVRSRMEQSGHDSLVIGLSGGIDSALTAVLCRRMLPRDQVKCVFLPDEATPRIDREHVQRLVRTGDLNCHETDITDLIACFTRFAVAPPDKVALGNVKARLRMVLLYEYANMTRSLVCGTSNKSELMVGYFTKYGDGGADLLPIGWLYKTEVWDLAKFMGLPQAIVAKPPSAGLFEGQTDEGELKMSYRMLDRILRGLEQNRSDASIAEGTRAPIEDVRRIREMVAHSAHKRRPPPMPSRESVASL